MDIYGFMLERVMGVYRNKISYDVKSKPMWEAPFTGQRSYTILEIYIMNKMT